MQNSCYFDQRTELSCVLFRVILLRFILRHVFSTSVSAVSFKVGTGIRLLLPDLLLDPLESGQGYLDIQCTGYCH